MDDSTKELLEKNLEVSRQSLELLKKLHQDLVWRRTLALLRTIIIVGLLVFGFIQIRPYLETFAAAFQKLIEGLNQIQSLQLPAPLR